MKCAKALTSVRPPGAIRRQLVRFLPDEGGATAIEYGLIAALSALAVIPALDSMGGKLASTLNSIGQGLGKAPEAAPGMVPPGK